MECGENEIEHKVSAFTHFLLANGMPFFPSLPSEDFPGSELRRIREGVSTERKAGPSQWRVLLDVIRTVDFMLWVAGH